MGCANASILPREFLVGVRVPPDGLIEPLGNQFIPPGCLFDVVKGHTLCKDGIDIVKGDLHDDHLLVVASLI